MLPFVVKEMKASSFRQMEICIIVMAFIVKIILNYLPKHLKHFWWWTVLTVAKLLSVYLLWFENNNKFESWAQLFGLIDIFAIFLSLVWYTLL